MAPVSGALAERDNGEQTLLVIFERLLEVGEVALLVCPRDGAHALDVPQLRVLRGKLYAQQGRHIFRLYQHSECSTHWVQA